MSADLVRVTLRFAEVYSKRRLCPLAGNAYKDAEDQSKAAVVSASLCAQPVAEEHSKAAVGPASL